MELPGRDDVVGREVLAEPGNPAGSDSRGILGGWISGSGDSLPVVFGRVGFWGDIFSSLITVS
ncbi:MULTISPECIES: hypothetical protein [unclassified Pseudomonas]|uniref:hypothetical protein n=1 Tax=unclassified Pseudomonas TaxID=196821 RepID=UPI0030D7A84F